MSADAPGMSSDPYRPVSAPSSVNETAGVVNAPKANRQSRLDKRYSTRIYRFVTGYPLAITAFIIVTYLILAWFGYLHHLFHHKFISGKFTQHERAICQKEDMLLYIQRFMWMRAKSEISNIIHDEESTLYHKLNIKDRDNLIQQKALEEKHVGGRYSGIAMNVTKHRERRAEENNSKKGVSSSGSSGSNDGDNSIHMRPDEMEMEMDSGVFGIDLDEEEEAILLPSTVSQNSKHLAINKYTQYHKINDRKGPSIPKTYFSRKKDWLSRRENNMDSMLDKLAEMEETLERMTKSTDTNENEQQKQKQKEGKAGAFRGDKDVKDIHKDKEEEEKEDENEGGEYLQKKRRAQYRIYLSTYSDTKAVRYDEHSHIQKNVQDPLNPYRRYRISNDLGFYQYSYGTVSVETVSSTHAIGHSMGIHNAGNGFSTIVYYRIWKAANDYIRGCLYQFAHKKVIKDGDRPVCTNLKECQNAPSTYHIPNAAIRNMIYPSSMRRYPFTFVRDPIERFISGYTEIEYRYQQKTENDYHLHITTHDAVAESKKRGPGTGKSEIKVVSQSDRTKRIGKSSGSEYLGRSRTHKIKKNPIDRRKDKLRKEKERLSRENEKRRQQTLESEYEGGSEEEKARERDSRVDVEEGYVDWDSVFTTSNPNVHVLPLKSALGSALRFQEFIDTILHFDGSRRIFRTYDANNEMAHIAPQVGTLLAANEAESLPIRLYHLESFKEEWKRFSKDVNQPRMLQIRNALKNQTHLWRHPSSEDIYHTKIAAQTFLQSVLDMNEDHVIEDILESRITLSILPPPSATVLKGSQDTQDPYHNYYKDKVSNWYTKAQEFKQYLTQHGLVKELLIQPHYRTAEILYTRALCRIYLSDYVCADYDLPFVCRDIHQEIESLEKEYEQKEDANRAVYYHAMIYLNQVIPSWLMFNLLEIPCSLLSTSPPTCIAKLMHGESLYDRDEDADDVHEEL